MVISIWGVSLQGKLKYDSTFPGDLGIEMHSFGLKLFDGVKIVVECCCRIGRGFMVGLALLTRRHLLPVFLPRITTKA